MEPAKLDILNVAVMYARKSQNTTWQRTEPVTRTASRTIKLVMATARLIGFCVVTNAGELLIITRACGGHVSLPVRAIQSHAMELALLLWNCLLRRYCA